MVMGRAALELLDLSHSSGDTSGVALTFPALLSSGNDCLLLVSHFIGNICACGLCVLLPVCLRSVLRQWELPRNLGLHLRGAL